MRWIREPENYTIEDGTIKITTKPGTDLWQRTYYHFRNDNAPAFQMETEERFFSFVVKMGCTGAHHRFDQCGIVMYLDSENWLKGSVEYENKEFQHLGSVATNHGYSDWATTAIPAQVKTMWYRFSRREDDYCIECSPDGKQFTQMRVCHMWKGAGKISFGISPTARRILLLRQSSPTWRSQIASGWLMMGRPLTKHSGIRLTADSFEFAVVFGRTDCGYYKDPRPKGPPDAGHKRACGKGDGVMYYYFRKTIYQQEKARGAKALTGFLFVIFNRIQKIFGCGWSNAFWTEAAKSIFR